MVGFARKVTGLFYGVDLDNETHICKVPLPDGPRRYVYHYFAGLCADIHHVKASRLLPRLCNSGFRLILPDRHDRFVLAYVPKHNLSPSRMLIILRGTETADDLLTDINVKAHVAQQG